MSIPRTNHVMSILTCFPLHHSKHVNKNQIRQGNIDWYHRCKKKHEKQEEKKAPEKSTVRECGSPTRSRNEYHIRIDKKRKKLMTMSKGNFFKEMNE